MSPSDLDGQARAPRLIVVLGMHRSGTSAITRGLQVLGVELGNSLMPPQAINAKGFFEDIDFNALNIDMLDSLRAEWHSLAPLSLHDFAALRAEGYVEKAVALLKRKAAGVPLFGFKDPRVTKLLPLWSEAISSAGFSPIYVLALRHPRSVADSLAERDGFEAEKSYLLWLGHVIAGLAGSAGHARVLVDYDRLLHSPAAELGRIAARIGTGVDAAALHEYKSAFLDPTLRHALYRPEDLRRDPACPALVLDVYDALLDVASDKKAPEDIGLPQWSEEFGRAAPYLTLVDRICAQNAVLEKTVVEREMQIAHVIAEREQRVRALTESTSWRITKPLRALRRLMS